MTGELPWGGNRMKEELVTLAHDTVEGWRDAGDTFYCPAINAHVGFSDVSAGKLGGCDPFALRLVGKIPDLLDKGVLVFTEAAKRGKPQGVDGRACRVIGGIARHLDGGVSGGPRQHLLLPSVHGR
ncbi:MAG: hypothetical protein EOP83_36315 [Verrucomicrobiaceae bacterium]|nr:MAG: hypothetical protein EOP83_36315 [Verrucomicrobiaceae bacterium]